jgi:hypothetical protein
MRSFPGGDLGFYPCASLHQRLQKGSDFTVLSRRSKCKADKHVRIAHTTSFCLFDTVQSDLLGQVMLDSSPKYPAAHQEAVNLDVVCAFSRLLHMHPALAECRYCQPIRTESVGNIAAQDG